MAVPGASTRLIADLVPDVIEALQQRTDVANLVPKYIRKTIIELTESNAFEELRRTGPSVQLTANQAIYPVSMFLNSGDDYNYPESFNIFVDYPGNTVQVPLDYKTPRGIQSIISPATVGVPSYFTRFGTNFSIAPQPANPYTCQLLYQVKHPFPDDLSVTSLSGQQLCIPDSWEEIVVYGAAERIAFVKRWNEQSKACHDILYGDPNNPGARPGLIANRVLQNERDSKFNTRSIGILTPRYGSR